MTRLLWAVATLAALSTLAPPASAAVLQHHESRDSRAHAIPVVGHPPYTADQRGDVVRRLPKSSDAGPGPHDRAIAVVRLGPAFSPASVTLTTGEPLLIVVSSAVTATANTPASGVLTGGPLAPDTFLYFGAKPGSTTFAAFVGPHCVPPAMCPMWRTAPRLTVTVLP